MAVQEYRADIENAQNAQQKQEALDGLVGAMMARTQKAWLQSHPAADLNEAARNMKKALLSYGQGNATVQEALENAGFSAPQPGSHTMRVMSYIGQQAAMLEEQAKAEENQKQYSIEQYEKNGKVLSYVKADRQVIAGNDPQEWGEQITKYINEEIRHKKDVTVYTENGVPLTITEDTAGKAAYWNENREGDPVSAEEYGLKLRIEAHIDEAAQVSRGSGAKKRDMKNHLFAKDGWNYRTAYFEDFNGNYYSFQISVGKNGKVNTIYNVNRIQKEAALPKALRRSAVQSPTVGSTASMGRIAQEEKEVNKKVFSLSSETEKMELQ